MSVLIDALQSRAKDTPRAVAYVVDRQAITYGSLLEDVRTLASRLRAQGIGHDERCALVLPTSLDFIRSFYAVQWAGGVPVALNPDLPPPAIARRINLVQPVLTLSTTALQTLARETRADPSAQPARSATYAFFQLTSGTTGDPRAAMISHRNLAASLRAAHERTDLRATDVFAAALPLHYSLGLVRYVFSPLVAGCPGHLISPSMTDLGRWLLMIDGAAATITAAPDSAYRLAARMVDPARVSLRSLRIATTGGETVRMNTIKNFEQRFRAPGVVRPGYGLAEATLTVTNTAPQEALHVDATGNVSCGRPLSGFEVRVVDPHGADATADAAGEIVVRGDAVFDGYFDDERSTRAVLRDGWLHTGDIGALDVAGRLYVRGRERALIKRGGAAIAPREIEDAVNDLDRVHASAALGVALTVNGTEDIVVVAEIDGVEGLSALDRDRMTAGIDAVVMAAVGFAPARVLLFAPGTMPRTAAGKVKYDDLRQVVQRATARGANRRY